MRDESFRVTIKLSGARGAETVKFDTTRKKLETSTNPFTAMLRAYDHFLEAKEPQKPEEEPEP